MQLLLLWTKSYKDRVCILVLKVYEMEDSRSEVMKRSSLENARDRTYTRSLTSTRNVLLEVFWNVYTLCDSLEHTAVLAQHPKRQRNYSSITDLQMYIPYDTNHCKQTLLPVTEPTRTRSKPRMGFETKIQHLESRFNNNTTDQIKSTRSLFMILEY